MDLLIHNHIKTSTQLKIIWILPPIDHLIQLRLQLLLTHLLLPILHQEFIHFLVEFLAHLIFYFQLLRVEPHSLSLDRVEAVNGR